MKWKLYKHKGKQAMQYYMIRKTVILSLSPAEDTDEPMELEDLYNPI